MYLKKIVVFFLLALPLCSAAAADLQTPLEENHFTQLSTHSEMMRYLTELDRKSDVLRLSVIGKSVQGREIPALFFSLDSIFAQKRGQKPLVLIFCQQHGNEPSGKEAALMLARYLTGKGKKLLQKLDLILVPQVNPDGSEMNTRRNARKMDLNRNHVILSEPEAQALHRLFLDWMPEVTLDIHEYNALKKSWLDQGLVKDAAEMLGGVTNVNIDSALLRFSRRTVIPAVGSKIKKDGFSFHRYLVGSPFNGGRVRYSTTNVNDGRQSMGIYNTLSFIIEGKRYGNVLNKIKWRTEGQFSAQKAFLQVIGQNAGTVLNLVQAARAKLVQENAGEFCHIQMDYFKDPNHKSVSFPVFDFSQWKTVQKELQPFAAKVKVKKSIRKPFAYIFSQDETELIALLKKHRIRMKTLTENISLKVQSYTILHVTPGINEDKSTLDVDAEMRQTEKQFRKGDVLVALNQPASNLIPLMLEPQSTFSICQKRNGHKYRFKSFLQEGKTYPVLRIPAALKPELMQDLLK